MKKKLEKRGKKKKKTNTFLSPFLSFFLCAACSLRLLLQTLFVVIVTAISSHNPVPPSEGRAVVSEENHVVMVMEIGTYCNRQIGKQQFEVGEGRGEEKVTSPEREKMAKAPGKVVARVGINDLEETKDHKDP